MGLTTTLNRIKDHNPCNSKDGDTRDSGWNKLIDFLGHNYPPDKGIDLLTILESNGLKDATWSLRATGQDSRTISVKIAIAAAEYVLPIFEDKCPNDDRPRKAIEAVKRGVADADAAATAYVATAVDAIEKIQNQNITINGLTEIIKNILKKNEA